MNAYELADELQELDSKLHLINLFKSANMLRQQADRIAELEKLTKEPTNLFAVPELMEKAGYIQKPTPLSDSEIRTIQDMCHLKNVGYNTFIMRFARTIEKRHGIK